MRFISIDSFNFLSQENKIWNLSEDDRRYGIFPIYEDRRTRKVYIGLTSRGGGGGKFSKKKYKKIGKNLKR